jgi:glycosyltransferase involved in cell wall biosynthesis
VVVPAFDEESRLGATLARIADYLLATGIDGEIVVVDDGSSDGTSRVAEEALRGRRGRILRNAENRGKGHAFRRGFLESAGRWVLLTDADLSAPIEEHAKLAVAARDHDLDVAFGSRALPESRVEARQHVMRQSMGKSFNALVRAATRLPYRDTQCGFKLLHRERCRPVVEKMVVDGFAFDVELLFLCTRFGLRAREVPVVWRDARGSKVGLVGDPLRMLLDLARIRWRFRRGMYNPSTRGEAT